MKITGNSNLGLFCKECKKHVLKKVSYLRRRSRENKRDFYCSRGCADKAHKKRMTGKNNPNYNGKWHGPDIKDIPREVYVRNGKKAIERMKHDGTYEERMRKLHQGHEKFFATPEGRKLRRSNGVKTITLLGKGIRTSIEIKMAEELTSRGIKYIEQYNIGNRYVADFYLSEYNIVIECDGDYWHNLPEVKAKDERKNVYIKSRGYSLYRFWESEINESVEACVDIILAEINEKEAIA